MAGGPDTKTSGPAYEKEHMANKFWTGFGRIAAKIALWAAANPQVIQEVVTAAKK